VVALWVGDGSVRWNTATQGSVIASPAVSGGLVYIGDTNFEFLALHVQDGSTAWRLASPQLQAGVRSSAAVSHGTVYFGSDGANVYAVNASTGAVDWTYLTNGPVESSPAVTGGTVYVGSDDSNIYALNAATGAKLWSYDTDGGVGNASPEVANGVVYTTGNGFAIALNPATGAELWSSPTGTAFLGTAVVSGGRLYAGATDGEEHAFGLPLQILTTSATLPTAEVAQTYSATLSATGGVAPYGWQIVGGTLPNGLTLDPSTGSISGTPTQSGTKNLTLQVTDSESDPQTATAAVALVTYKNTVTVTTASLPAGTMGTAYSKTLAATGGRAPYHWGVPAGTLPPGLVLDYSSGSLVGTPTQAGTFTFDVTATDSSSPALVGSKAYTVSIAS
jgi:hypothetical protein